MQERVPAGTADSAPGVVCCTLHPGDRQASSSAMYIGGWLCTWCSLQAFTLPCHSSKAAPMACMTPSTLMHAAVPLLHLVTPKCWLPTVPQFQQCTTPLLFYRCIGLHNPWCSACAACVACHCRPSHKKGDACCVKAKRGARTC